MSRSMKQIRQEMEEYGRIHFGMKLIPKEESTISKILAFIVRPFCPDFQTRYVTTLNTTILGPKSWLENDEAVVRTLAHEYVHVYDWGNLKILFPILYLFPQILALGAFGALGAIWGPIECLHFLWCLLFLTPLPAPFRAHFEFRGYAMSMAMQYWIRGKLDRKNPPKYIVQNFVGSSYFFMWPFKKDCEARLREWIDLIETGEFSKRVPIAADIEKIVKGDK